MVSVHACSADRQLGGLIVNTPAHARANIHSDTHHQRTAAYELTHTRTQNTDTDTDTDTYHRHLPSTNSSLLHGSCAARSNASRTLIEDDSGAASPRPSASNESLANSQALELPLPTFGRPSRQVGEPCSPCANGSVTPFCSVRHAGGARGRGPPPPDAASSSRNVSIAVCVYISSNIARRRQGLLALLTSSTPARVSQ